MPDLVPDILFHYTSQNGLLGILRTKKIWATDLLYLNDASEFNHAIRIAQDQLDKLRKSLQGGDLHLLNRIADLLTLSHNRHIYTASFSEDGNALRQWKLYGSNYRGFSIGFSRLDLEIHGGKSSSFLQKCTYDEQEQSKIIHSMLEPHLQGFRDTMSNPNRASDNLQAIIDHYAEWFYGDLMVIASALKNSSFEAEREWRLVRHDYGANHNEVEFRESSFTLIPYKNIKLPESESGLSLKKIFTGPTLDPELTRRSLELLLSKYEIDSTQVEIVPSGIPIRDSSP